MTQKPVAARAKAGLVSWCLFDWANSAFPTVIITFVFSAYVTKAVADTPVQGTAYWGYAMSISALLVALCGPVFGAIADFTGKTKSWLFITTGLCVAASALLWFIEPSAEFLILALLLAGLGNFAFETSMVFYNAMMGGLVSDRYLGRLSGWGWGLGYLGGLICLALALVGFVQPEISWFGLNKDQAENIRILGPLVALWITVFAVPLFLFTPDRPATGMALGKAIKNGLKALYQTVAKIKDYKAIAHFLLARMIYTDGLNTLFAFGGIYAAGSFGFGFEELIMFGILLNVTAGLGAAGFAVMDDRIGPKPVILMALAALTIIGALLLVIDDKTQFWILGALLGIFIGPAQSASRSLMAHMAPEKLTNEMFGLYALSGKATAFLGPAILATVTTAFDSQRAGMATVLIFFVIGAVMLAILPVSRRGKAPTGPS